MKIFLFKICISSAVLFLLPGCVTTYQPATLESMTIDDYKHNIMASNLEIAMEHNVLEGPANKQYARMERKNKVNLVLLSIQNDSAGELNLSNDLLFQTSDGQTLMPLTLVEAMEALVKPVTNDENESVVEVETEGDLKFFWGIGKVVNTAKKVVSHVRFSKDMMDHYMENRLLSPSSTLKGFLVLPVKKGTPVTVTLR